MSMKPNIILPSNHPSASASNAIFIFQTMPLKGTGTVILVHAMDKYQVFIVEKLLMKSGHISPYIKVLAVIRDVKNYGIRSDASEIPLYEFLRDCADPDAIMSDPEIRQALSMTFGESVPEPVDHSETVSSNQLLVEDRRAIKILKELGFDDEASSTAVKKHLGKPTSEIVKLVVKEMSNGGA